MILHKLIVHELVKESGSRDTEMITSTDLLPIDNNAIELVESLLQSYQGDKILNARFDESPGRNFPPTFINYKNGPRTDENFIEFTTDVTGHLETIIQSVNLAKGGYLLFSEYSNNGIDLFAIFLIRDVEGKILERRDETFGIGTVEYLDTNHLAMACRINEGRMTTEENYLSFTQKRQQEVSDYFTEWISVLQMQSSTEFTKSLYDILNSVDPPLNEETNERFTVDDVRNMVYDTAKANPQKVINLQVIGAQIYGDPNILTDYAEENDIAIDTEFRFDKRELGKYVRLSVNKDGINLKISRGDVGTKIRPSEENEDMVIIESRAFAEALRSEMS